VKPAAFEYIRVDTVDEAVARLGELGDDAKIIAGGQSLAPMMNFRLARPSALVDITRIPSLRYMYRQGGALRIGALTTHHTVETSRDPGLADGYDVLRRAARWVGHYPIRTRGTFGGSIAHADPSAEWPMLALLLDAEVVAVGPEGERTIPAAELFQGFMMTSLAPDELLTEVRFPAPAPHAAISEFARRHGDFAIVAAAVALDMDDGVCRSARVVLGGVADAPVRVAEAEEALAGATLGDDTLIAAGRAAADAIDPPSDLHGSGDYRRELASVLVKRAVREAAGVG
jgi:aerobic carbon-monoxide dehydrogenase medium subunit